MAADPDPTLPALMSRKEVQVVLGCSGRHVQRLMERGDIPAPLRVGALVRWRKDAIANWIAAGCPRQGQRSRRG